MRIPTIPWVIYTLFRLTAVVFLSWALVAQFIALSDDMKVYSSTESQSADQASSSSTSSMASNTSAMVGTLSSPSLGGEYTGVVTDTGGSNTLTTLATATMKVSTTTVEAGSTSTGSMITTGRIAGVIGYNGLVRRHTSVPEAQNRKRDVAEDQGGYFGESSVPTHPGGAFFVVLSRLLMAITAFALVFVQVGVPEKWLYDHVSWLGPQSTPLSLGTLQVILAIENLRVHASSSVLTPSWALFAIGLINVLLGIVTWLCTFTGHGVTEAGRNVPAGHLEVRGGRTQYTTEDEERVRVQQGTQPLNVRPKRRDTPESSRQPLNDLGSREKRRPRKGDEKKASLAPLDLRGSAWLQGTGLLRLPPTRTSAFDTIKPVPEPPRQNGERPGKKIPGRSLTAPDVTPQNAARQQVPAMTPIKEETRSAQATPVAIHPPSNPPYIPDPLQSVQTLHSLDVATAELGPRFPLPPSQTIPNKPKTGGLSEAARARRESSVDSMAGAGRRYAALAMAPELSPEPEKVTKSYPRKSEKPAAYGPSLNVPAPPSREPSPTTPKDWNNAQLLPPSLRSSLAPETRSPFTASAHSERVSKGVRFDGLSPTPGTDTRRSSTVLPRDSSHMRHSVADSHDSAFSTPVSASSADSTSDDDEDEVSPSSSASSEDEAARPESFASTSSRDTLSVAKVISGRGHPRDSVVSSVADVETVSSTDMSSRRRSEEKAGLPRRDSAISPKTIPKARRSMDSLSDTQPLEMKSSRETRRRHSSIDST